MDPITIVAIISAVGALCMSILTHIKHSSCGPCIDIDTRTPLEEKKLLFTSS